MANPKSKTESTKPAAAVRKPAKPSRLVAVVKDGEKIEISPLTVENHLQLGWKRVFDVVVPASEEPADDDLSVSTETPDEGDPDGADE
jgi:hypothetical protein